MASFTHYWQGSTCDYLIKNEGELLSHTAGNQFKSRGVQVGSQIYIVTVRNGTLYVIARLEVAKIVSMREAQRHFKSQVWEADEHIICKPSACTRMRFNKSVPVSVTKQLLFERGSHYVSPVFKTDTKLDQQTMRGVRKLSDSSAALLEKYVSK